MRKRVRVAKTIVCLIWKNANTMMGRLGSGVKSYSMGINMTRISRDQLVAWNEELESTPVCVTELKSTCSQRLYWG